MSNKEELPQWLKWAREIQQLSQTADRKSLSGPPGRWPGV